MTLLRTAICVLGAAAMATVAWAAVRLEQFAVGWPLELPAPQSVYDVPLTLDVYRNAASDAQLAVLDAAGEPMPFYRVVAAATADERRTRYAASPLYAAPPQDAVAKLDVATADRQTNVTVTRPAGDAAPAIVGFVIDARAAATAPLALELEWRAQAQPFLLDVVVEQSSDLTSWQRVGRASVASLSVDGGTVRHNRVPVSAAAGGYFRITGGRSLPDWYLDGATFVTSTATLAPRATTSLTALAAPAVPRDAPVGALYFDAGGPLPIGAVALEFTSGTGWARAEVAAANALDGPWSSIERGELYYSVDYDGERLASPAVEVGRRVARYWRVTPARPLAAERVALRIEFQPERLRFSAAGTAPYLLAAGTVVPGVGPDATFAAVWRDLRPTTPPPVATLGARRELGGDAALAAPFELPWRTLLLWLVLAVGVAGVAWMAVKLARELRESPPPQ